MKFTLKKKQKGFTLIELGIVVAIAAVIIGLGLIVVPGILASNRANGEISDLPAISTKIQRAFANQPNFATPTQANMSVLVPLKVFPDNEVVAGSTTVNNRWGGTITAQVASLQTGNDAVSITETNVPDAECTQVVQGVDRSFRAIAVNGQPVKSDGQTQVRLDTLGTACANANNQLTFTFGK